MCIKKHRPQKERYSITIYSQSDARVRTIFYSVSRKAIVIAIVFLFVLTALSASVLAVSTSKGNEYTSQITRIQNSFEIQTAQKFFAVNMSSEPPEAAEKNVVLICEPSLDSARSEPLQQKTLQQDAEPDFLAYADLAADTIVTAVKEAEKDDISIPMNEAIEFISLDFQSKIDSTISAAIENEEYAELCVVYDGDFEGDSDLVNNWADVVSVFVAQTMYDDQKLLTMPKSRLETLEDIYNSMNAVSIYLTRRADIRENVRETVLTVHVTVDCLTYDEGAEIYKLDLRQLKKLELMMSPDYYIYFSQLLGIDVYDGMDCNEVKSVIENLPDTTGAAVIKAALIRLGNPYSRAKRGSGSYVDCSYFTWWAYNQVGITIPTSSVEQARYCYNNGYEVDASEIMTGDLVFWSKKNCRCGRWHEIHHAAIYIGDGKIIEASSDTGCVVIRNLWGIDSANWKIFMYARPCED